MASVAAPGDGIAMQTAVAAAVLVALGLGLPVRAATPTTNPADIDRDVIRRVMALKDDLQQADDLDALPTDAKMAAYVEERRPILDLMHKAATLPHADWGDVDWSTFDGDLDKVLPALKGGRSAVMVTWIATRYDAAQGRPGQAVDELLSGIALARHVGQEPLTICEMVEIGCENGSIDCLAAMLPGLPKDVAASLPARLDALPPSIGLAAVFDGEKRFGQAVALRRLAATQPAKDPTMTAAQTASYRSMVDQIGPFYDAIKPAASGTPAEFKAAIDSAVAKVPGNVLIQVLVPSLSRVRGPAAMVEAKWAMLRAAAAAIAANGPQAFADFRDPFGAGPFTRTETPGGYTLISKLVFHDKPVTLTVGR